MDMNLRGSLTQLIVIDDPSHVGHARRQVRELAQRHALAEADGERAALLATELASNIIKHAERGALHLRAWPHAEGAMLELLAIDRAQGFDRAACLTDGFSTSGTQGIGLGAIERLADTFDLYSDARGTALLARVHGPRQDRRDLRIGVCQHTLPGETVCGDGWYVAKQEGHLSVLMIDGLGHGEHARTAADAGETAFAQAPYDAPARVVERLHGAMGATRGGAVAVIQHDAALERLTFAGIGNIGGVLLGRERARGLASMPGIVGGQYRKVQVFDYPQVNDNLLILYSDGLQSRWDLKDYPGLAYRHPALVAAVLHRDFCRGRDDVTIMVIDLEGVHA
ncbi:ATP-binding protein [Pseudomonas parafulva]|uniref:ATP-binding protein n=1 Tax=Pseudomonas parafulva TaxID=157782 RepID=UPI000A826DA1|nr:ATP-binding protein [Pseudomonas parafulva]